ncbi:Uncharacterised protein [Mycobacteroides abscessus subsp. abscessus]|nr:Uncharacterised protein [Mycobacteroides abscessus subsp. abscessus]
MICNRVKTASSTTASAKQPMMVRLVQPSCSPRMKPSTRKNRPAEKVIMPGQSTGGGVSLRDSRTFR